MEHAAAQDVARLSKLLESDDDRVRAKAVKALGKLDDLRSLDLLLRAYGDPSRRVNKAVVKALARREGERAYSILIAAAGGGNISALHALEKQPVPQAVPALAEALDSPWYDVYYAALRATQAHVATFQGNQEVLASLRRLIPELSYLLHDDSARIRRLALETLGMFQEPETVEDIAFMLMDPKEDIRYLALQILESIGDGRAGQALAAYLEREGGNGIGRTTSVVEDEDLSTEVEEAIAKIRGATSVTILSSEDA
jgi:HEAT repeat protein